MMFRFNQPSGFSLIELIVVMAIMAVLMTLSGGLFQKSISQQERHVELEQVGQLFHQLSYQAYYGGSSLRVRLENNTLSIIPEPANEEVVVKEYVFKQLTFVAQDYQISSKGIISPNNYGVFWQTNIKHLLLESTFNEITAQ